MSATNEKSHQYWSTGGFVLINEFVTSAYIVSHINKDLSTHRVANQN